MDTQKPEVTPSEDYLRWLAKQEAKLRNEKRFVPLKPKPTRSNANQ